MELTKEQLKQLLPKNPYLDHWYGALSQLLPDYEINTPQRIAAFIAQCAHESGEFTTLKENSDSLTPKRSMRNNSKMNYKEDDDHEEYDKKPQRKKFKNN